MVAKNDITGDSIQTRVNSEKYMENFDKIFQKKPEVVARPDGICLEKCGPRCWLEVKNDLFICEKKGCGYVKN